jgi:hypothetical protein
MCQNLQSKYQESAILSRIPGVPDPPSVKFAGDSRRWVRRRTKVLQVPTNKEDPVKSADPKGHTVFKALAAKNEGKNSLTTNSAR